MGAQIRTTEDESSDECPARIHYLMHAALLVGNVRSTEDCRAVARREDKSRDTQRDTRIKYV